jgi:uncharacterized protein YwgA
MAMERTEFLLLVVAAGDGKPLTPVQLEKTLFLIGRANFPEAPEPFYEFERYHYGPFAKDIYADADILSKEGLVARIRSERGTWTDTVITASGSSKAAALKKSLSPRTIKYIDETVRWAQSLSFSDLLRAIYSQYPEFRENSVFQG